MYDAIEAFLRYMHIERNASPLTLKSYAEDLDSLLVYFTEQIGSIPAPADVGVSTLRGYIAYLHECQYARTTIARRLACLRSFFRYCCREKLTDFNPRSEEHTSESSHTDISRMPSSA